VFCSLDELTTAQEDWIKVWNANARPFKWTKAAGQIIERGGRAKLPRSSVGRGRTGASISDNSKKRASALTAPRRPGHGRGLQPGPYWTALGAREAGRCAAPAFL